MNKNNYIFYAIIIYIIIISILIITKPDCIYDHNKSKFKEFGYTKDKTMFPIAILSIFIAVIIIILFSFLSPNNDDNSKNIIPQYVMSGGQFSNMVTPMYQQQMYHPLPINIPIQVQIPSVKTTLSSEQIVPNVMYQMPQMHQMGGYHQMIPQMTPILQSQVQQVPHISQVQQVPHISQVQHVPQVPLPIITPTTQQIQTTIPASQTIQI
jgi:hypothetical protein